MVKHFLPLLLSLICLQTFGQEANKKPEVILQGSNNDLNSVAISSNKYKRMAIGGWDNVVLIYKTDSPFQLVQKLTGHSAPINTLAYNLSGNMLASGSADNFVKFYDSLYRILPVKDEFKIRHESPVNSLVFDKGGKYLFSGDRDGKLILWDALNQKAIKFYQTGNSINDLCLSPNVANIFIAQSDKSIKLVSLTTGKLVRTMDGHTDGVNVLAISNNNQYLISGSNDKTARIWDLKNWKPLHVLNVGSWKITAVAFSDDNKYCVTGCNDGNISVWETETGKLVEKAVFNEMYIKDIAFSKNGKLLIVAPKMKESTDFGARIISSMIPQVNNIQNNNMLVSPAQKSMDSILAIRPLNKQDSIKFKSYLQLNSNGKSGKNNANSTQPLDSAIIYKTPMYQNQKSK